MKVKNKKENGVCLIQRKHNLIVVSNEKGLNQLMPIRVHFVNI